MIPLLCMNKMHMTSKFTGQVEPTGRDTRTPLADPETSVRGVGAGHIDGKLSIKTNK